MIVPIKIYINIDYDDENGDITVRNIGAGFDERLLTHDTEMKLKDFDKALQRWSSKDVIVDMLEDIMEQA